MESVQAPSVPNKPKESVPQILAPVFTPSEVVREEYQSTAVSTATLAEPKKQHSGAISTTRKGAEKKLQQMITSTGPELFVHGAYSDVKLPTDGSPNTDDGGSPIATSSLVNLTCKEAAPFDKILEFMTSVMTKEYENALRVGKEILKYEPDNKIVADFIPVLEEISSFSESEDESSESEVESSSGSSSDESTSDSETDSNESERSPSTSEESDDEDEDEENVEGDVGGNVNKKKATLNDGLSSSSEDDDDDDDSSQDSCTSYEDGEEISCGPSDDAYNSEEVKTMNQRTSQ